MQNFRWGLMAALGAIFVSVAMGILFGVNPIDIFVRALVFGAVFLGLGFGLRFVLNSFFPEVLYTDEEGAAESEQTASHIDITIDSMGEYAVPELFRSDDDEEMGNIEDLISGVFRADSGYGQAEPVEKAGFAPGKTFESVDGKSESGYNDVGFFNDLEAEMPEAGDESSQGGFSAALQGFTPLPIEGGGSFQDVSLFQKPESASPAGKPAAAHDEQFTPSLGEDAGLGGLPDLDMMARAFSSAYGAEEPPVSAPPSAAPSSAPLLTEDEPDRSQYKGNKPQTLQGDFQAKDIARGLSTLLSKDK